MRDNGLIMTNRTLGWISKYAEAIGSEAKCSRFLAFMQICSPIQFDKLVESLKYFADLQKSIFRYGKIYASILITFSYKNIIFFDLNYIFLVYYIFSRY